MSRKSVGRTAACHECGAELIANVRVCPACGSLANVDPELVQELAAHEAKAQKGLDIVFADEQARRWFDHLEQGPNWGVLFVILGPFAVAFAGAAASVAWPDHEGLAVGLLVGVYAIGTVIAFKTYGDPIGRIDAHDDVQREAVECPACGGPNPLRADRGLAPCTWCGAALAGSAETLANLRRNVEAAKRRSETALRHAEWRLAAKNNNEPRTDLVPVVMFTFLFGMFPLIALVELGRAAGGNPADELPVAVAVGAAVAALLVAWHVARARWRRRFREGLARLAGEGGRVFESLPPVATWLSQHWRGAYKPKFIARGRWFGGVIIEHGGHSVLVLVNTFKLEQNRMDPFAHVLMARNDVVGRRAPLFDGDPTVTVRSYDGGWSAKMSESWVEGVLRDPGAVAELDDVVDRLGRS